MSQDLTLRRTLFPVDGHGPVDLPRSRPLVVTADPRLLEEVLRLCAAAGVTPVVAADAASARRSWAGAPLVVVGDDLAGDVATGRLSRRTDVAVVTLDASRAPVWAAAVTIGADQVYALPAEQEQMIEVLANCLDGHGADATVVSVVAGCGGAGASCLAGALALTAAQEDRSALLVDADPLAGGIDMVLGNESVVGLRWPDLASTEGRISGRSLREALPALGSLSMLSWDRGDLLTIPTESMRSVLSAASRAHEMVVVDVPRRFDDAALEALAHSSRTLLVVPADIRAIAAAARLLGPLRDVAVGIELVVRGPGPSGIDADVVASTLELPVAVRMRPDERLARSIDDGLGPVPRRRAPLAAAARTLVRSLIGRRP